MPQSWSRWLLVFCLILSVAQSADAARKKQRRRRYLGPPPTHPVVLWSRTLQQSTDVELRRQAAYKLSHYSQLIFQQEAVAALSKCVKDPDTKTKIWCTQAMGRAGTNANSANIRSILLDQYRNDPELKDTIVRAFIVRRDDSKEVHDTFLETLKKSKSPEEQITLLGYFEKFGSSKMLDTVIEVFNKSEQTKVKTAAVAALSSRAEGQDNVVAFMAQCASQHESLETPLVLTCLSGLQQQARKDVRTWQAVEKTLDSGDADVVYATLDLINALPESQNEKIATKLLKIIQDVEDEDTIERAVLALGVCGTSSQAIADTLHNQLANKESSEGIRIASALVLGKQSSQSPEKPKELLSKCSKDEKSQSLRTACQLGLKDLEARKTVASPQSSSDKEAKTDESKREIASEKDAESDN